MSWMQFLAVSRSFSSIENRPTRFRMRDEYLLPRFGRGQEEETCAQPPKTESGAGHADDVKRAREKGSVMETNLAEAGVSTSAATPATAYPGGRWKVWRNPFGQKSAPQTGVAPVQGELRLESVKVKRNDLTDSDLMLVPLRSTGGSAKRTGDKPRKTGADGRPGLLGRVQEFFAGF